MSGSEQPSSVEFIIRNFCVPSAPYLATRTEVVDLRIVVVVVVGGGGGVVVVLTAAAAAAAAAAAVIDDDDFHYCSKSPPGM